MRATADYASSFPAENPGDPVGLEVQTGGDPVYLDFKGNDLIGIDIGMADIAIADFLYLRGSLAFRKGDIYDVQVNLGGLQPLVDSLNDGAGINLPSPLPLQVTAMTLAGANLTGYAGVGGPYRYGEDGPDLDHLPDQINQGAVGLVIDDVDFGLAIMTPTIGTFIPGMEQYAPKFVTAKAKVGTAGLVGVDPDLLSVQAQDVEVNINTFVVPSLGPIGNGILQLFGPPSIDYQASFATSPEDKNNNGVLDDGEDLDHDGKLAAYGLALPAGGDNAVIVDFNQEIVQAKVGYAQINLGGFLQLSASMAFTKKGSEQVTLSDGTQTTVTTLAIGINDAYGFVGVGGYWQDSNGDGRIDESDTPDTSAVGLAIENLDVGVVVAKELVISAEGVDVGVYLAAKATVTSTKGPLDLWANMVMLNCLQTWYDYSHDQRVLDLMTKYFAFELTIPDKDFLPPYWQHQRGADNLASVYWLYNHTGDPELLTLAEKIHRRTADWTDGVPDWHNVNMTQAFGGPATYYQQSHDQKHLAAAERNWAQIRSMFGQVPAVPVGLTADAAGVMPEQWCRGLYQPGLAGATDGVGDLAHGFVRFEKIAAIDAYAAQTFEAGRIFKGVHSARFA